MSKKEGEESKKKKEQKRPFFERVGKFTTNNYKLILIVWLVIVGAAIYPALRLQGVLSYNEFDFLPDDLEFHQGQEIFDELFPSNATGTTIIVMQSTEAISSEANLEYIEELTKRIYDKYGEDIYELQSILSFLDAYNQTYWNTLENALPTLNSSLIEQIILLSDQIYNTENTLQNIWLNISNHYTMNWFNFSRTYFYGLYNTTLFDTGPSIEVYDTIELFTNYTENMSISSSFVDYTYDKIQDNLTAVNQLNDQIMHQIAFDLTNMTLFQFYNSTESIAIDTYNQEIAPLLLEYYSNWTQEFTNQFTSLDYSIVNGTDFSKNVFDNSTKINSYQSQNVVLNNLTTINLVINTGFNCTSRAINQVLANYDINELIEEFADQLPISTEEIISNLEPLLPNFLSQVYILGKNPTIEDILQLTEIIINEMIEFAVELEPPPETIEDIPSILTQWVLSRDGKTSLILISYNEFNKTSDEINKMIEETDAAIGELAHQLKEELSLDNTEIYHTGDEFVTNTWMNQAERDAKLIDIFTIVFVLIILLIVFTSFVAPLIPLIAIGSSIAVSMAILWFISFGLDIHFMATLFLTVTSLGAGVDYCIFIFSRYNEERKNGKKKEDALVIAITYAGESVFHSGLTVMVGFGAMIIPNFPLLRILGISMCIGISISIIAALLVVPSIIMLIGDAIWWPKILQTLFRPQKWFKKKEEIEILDEEVPDGKGVQRTRQKTERDKNKSFLVRFSHFVTKNGLIITILTLVITAPFIYFTFTMDTSTDFMGMLPKDFEGTIGRDILSEEIPVGDPTPINVLIYDLNQSPLDYDIRYDAAILTDYILRIEPVSTIRTTVRPIGILMIEAVNGLFDDYVRSFVGEDNRSMLIEIYLDKSPYAKETEEFVANLPETISELINDRELDYLKEGKVHILGFARGLYEIKAVTDNAFPIIVPVVIIGVYLVLFFLFGSYFTPIRLIFTIALSIGFTLGLLQLVFSLGLNVPIFWLLPLMLFSILMGLGLDYDIFLVTRIKEYYDKGMSNKDAIAHALDHTASIITSCGTVMAAAYSSLLLSQLWHLRELGFAFALAIILDATVIRLIVVPAMMVLLEKLNWIGPKKLMRARHHTREERIDEK